MDLFRSRDRLPLPETRKRMQGRRIAIGPREISSRVCGTDREKCFVYLGLAGAFDGVGCRTRHTRQCAFRRIIEHTESQSNPDSPFRFFDSRLALQHQAFDQISTIPFRPPFLDFPRSLLRFGIPAGRRQHNHSRPASIRIVRSGFRGFSEQIESLPLTLMPREQKSGLFGEARPRE